MNAPRILVIQTKRIGDLILTAPALAELRRRFPTAEIELVVDHANRDLATCLPGLTRVLCYRSKGLNLGLWASLLLGPWDACLDFTGTDRSALFTLFTGAGRRLGYHRFSGKGLRARAYTELSLASVRDLHTVDFHQALVAQFVGEPHREGESAATLLQASEPMLAKVAQLAQEQGLRAPFAIVHPGTARREKFWPVERWISVAEHLHEQGLQVVVTGTGTGLEREDVGQLLGQVQVPVLDLTGRLTLAEMAVLMQRASLAVGVDSMAMHLASLWKVPQVVLFGPTNPFHWRPLHDRALVMVPHREVPVTKFEPRSKGGDMAGIQTQDVLSAVDSLIGKATVTEDRQPGESASSVAED